MTEYNKIIYTLPPCITREILKLCERRGGEYAEISEIRLRLYGKSSFKLGEERVELCSRFKRAELERTLLSLCGGALYPHRDTLAEGYISYEGGIRVGVCGEGGYDGGRLVGVSNVTSLVFRIPTHSVKQLPELYSAWEGTRRGMLVYSPPGVGKTTALRLLAGYIAHRGKQVVIIDTRHEFPFEDYIGVSVDILTGYRRGEGLDIALRSLAPDVMIVDEIGRSGEADAMLESLNSGVVLLASAHAATLCEAKRRKNLSQFFLHEIFDTFVGISAEGGRRVIKIERLEQ